MAGKGARHSLSAEESISSRQGMWPLVERLECCGKEAILRGCTTEGR